MNRKHLSILIISLFVVGGLLYVFIGKIVSKRSVLVKETTEYVYYKQYDIYNKDSCLHKYHKPIKYEGIVINKRKGSHVVGVVGKGGHIVTDHYITFKFGNNVKEENNIDLYNNFRLNEHMTVIEKFYPYYEISYSKLK